jgi:carbon monoxide dehydrogenase subunit G
MAGVIPDLDRIESVERTRLVCHVRPQFAFFSGKVKLTFEVAEQRAPESLKIVVRGKGIGGAVVVEIAIQLVQSGDGGLVNWQGEVVIKEGLFRPIGDTLISAAAGRIVDNLWEGFRNALVESPSACKED